jgi:glycerophosphoryl diester phosphodiesterase
VQHECLCARSPDHERYPPNPGSGKGRRRIFREGAPVPAQNPPRRPLVIAHRGASAAYPENTLEAFAGARAFGADAVELDARRTADGHLIVHHDAQLHDGRIIVGLTAADLPDHVPSLAEALDASAGMVVNIEIKNWPDDPDFDETELVAAGVVDLVRDTGWRDDVLISSFHLPTIDRVRALDDGLATAFLHIRIDGPTALARAVEHGHGALHPWDPFVTADLVARAHEQGVKVNSWTVDDPDRMRELASFGVDGIVTNVPDLALETLGG